MTGRAACVRLSRLKSRASRLPARGVCLFFREERQDIVGRPCRTRTCDQRIKSWKQLTNLLFYGPPSLAQTRQRAPMFYVFSTFFFARFIRTLFEPCSAPRPGQIWALVRGRLLVLNDRKRPRADARERRCGFPTEATMRHVFLSQLGVTPKGLPSPFPLDAYGLACKGRLATTVFRWQGAFHLERRIDRRSRSR